MLKSDPVCSRTSPAETLAKLSHPSIFVPIVETGVTQERYWLLTHRGWSLTHRKSILRDRLFATKHWAEDFTLSSVSSGITSTGMCTGSIPIQPPNNESTNNERQRILPGNERSRHVAPRIEEINVSKARRRTISRTRAHGLLPV